MAICRDILDNSQKMYSTTINSIRGKRTGYYNNDRKFALCDSCFWSATIFKTEEKNRNHIIYSCPLCSNSSISLIPLVIEDDICESSVGSKGGGDKILKSTQNQNSQDIVVRS